MNSSSTALLHCIALWDNSVHGQQPQELTVFILQSLCTLGCLVASVDTLQTKNLFRISLQRGFGFGSNSFFLFLPVHSSQAESVEAARKL